MSRHDPGAATGAIPTEPGHCECGEIESVHTVKDDGGRGGCSRSGCGCRQYRPCPDPVHGGDGGPCPTCGRNSHPIREVS